MVALKKASYPLDVLSIFLGTDLPTTGPGAKPHMVIEAGARVRKGKLALFLTTPQSTPVGARGGANRNDPAHRVDHRAGGAAIGEGAEVTRVRTALLTCELDGRKSITRGKGDEWIGLVVLEVGVEIRRVLVDELALQNQRLVLVANDDVFE